MDPYQSNIRCALHPKDYILRVDTEILCDKDLYCVECLLQLDNAVGLIEHCRPIDEFVEKASSFYEENRQKTQEPTEVPENYADILNQFSFDYQSQEEVVEAIKKHIEEEKKKVHAQFEEIIRSTMKYITGKRDEYLALLDQQVFNMRYGYIFLQKQLRKAFPQAEDSGLYPNKAELFAKLDTLKDHAELLTFVKNIKEDLNEKQLLPTEDGTLTEEEARRFLIKKLVEKLDEYKTKLPTIMEPEIDQDKLEKVRSDSDKAIEKYVDFHFSLENGIEDLSQGDAFPKSLIIKNPEFQMIKKWLEKEYQNKKFKLSIWNP